MIEDERLYIFKLQYLDSKSAVQISAAVIKEYPKAITFQGHFDSKEAPNNRLGFLLRDEADTRITMNMGDTLVQIGSKFFVQPAGVVWEGDNWEELQTLEGYSGMEYYASKDMIEILFNNWTRRLTLYEDKHLGWRVRGGDNPCIESPNGQFIRAEILS